MQLSLSIVEEKTFTEEQLNFIQHPGRESVVLSSTAGSGKTSVSIERMKFLLNSGVSPSRIIFFSFTKSATEELERRIERKDIKITTIHAFALGLLSRMGKFRKVADFYDFISWYKEDGKKYIPAHDSDAKNEFYETISSLYDDAEVISSEISAYKLQSADGIPCKLPDFYQQYREFLIKTKSRDFADMLIEVRDALKEDKWLRMFRDKYDYVFVDEYQDTSTIQMQILLALNAKYYYIIGDPNQSIYGYSGVNCNMIRQMLERRRTTVEKTLSVNFRSDIEIINNSNKFSTIKAIPDSTERGFVSERILYNVTSENKDEKTLVDVLNEYEEVAVLVRTNATIRKMEYELLKMKYPMKYFNYIKPKDIEDYAKGNIHQNLRKRLDSLKPFFGDRDVDIISFIEANKNSRKLITTIHKSKGREFDYCVVVNSLSPMLVEKIGLNKYFTQKKLARLTFDLSEVNDVESKNIHYVAITRCRHGLYFMLYDFD